MTDPDRDVVCPVVRVVVYDTRHACNLDLLSTIRYILLYVYTYIQYTHTHTAAHNYHTAEPTHHTHHSTILEYKYRNTTQCTVVGIPWYT